MLNMGLGEDTAEAEPMDPPVATLEERLASTRNTVERFEVIASDMMAYFYSREVHGSGFDFKVFQMKLQDTYEAMEVAYKDFR